MKNVLKFILFIAYIIGVFFVKDIGLLVGLMFLNLIFSMFLKINLKEMFLGFRFFLIFILFTVIINLFLVGAKEALILVLRMIIAYNMTYIFSKKMTVLEIAETIEKLAFPLKIFKVNTKNIGLMISISMCMVPIFSKEINTALYSLKAKGHKVGITNFSIVMKPILISVLKRTSEMEQTLIAKAYK